MSRKIKDRVQELVTKELELKKKLDWESVNLKSKASSITKIMLISGIVSLGVYVVYKTFVQQEEETPPESNKSRQTTSSAVTKKIVSFLLPYLGRFLDLCLLNSEKAQKRKKDNEGNGKQD